MKHMIITRPINSQTYLCFTTPVAVDIVETLLKGVLHPWPVFWLFMHFSQKLQHIGNK